MTFLVLEPGLLPGDDEPSSFPTEEEAVEYAARLAVSIVSDASEHGYHTRTVREHPRLWRVTFIGRDWTVRQERVVEIIEEPGE